MFIQVFIHDPLYAWAMTAKKAKKAGHGSQDQDGNANIGDTSSTSDAHEIINADAERAVLRVDLKLRVRRFSLSAC